MDTFLRENKDLLESATGESLLNLHIVLGNESCDLDSAVSALVWAYHLNKQQEVSQSSWDAVIPVLNLPHQDYPLCTEVTHFLSLANHIGGSSALVFRDDVDLHAQHAAEKLTLTLVDHNTLPKEDAALDAAVVEVIDHHSNGRHDDATRDIRVTVEAVGSCSTLVAEKILAQNPNIVDEKIAKLLLGPILMDTVNLSASAGRATAKDMAMVEALSSICPDLNKEEMYMELQQAKADMSDFTITDILRKDFKCVTGTSMNIGMSSLLMHLKEFVEKPDVETELLNFCISKNLRLHILMALTVDDSGETRRQICVYSPNSSDSMKDELIQVLEESSSPEILLSELDTNAPGLTVFDQGNVSASRKKVLPLVRDFLDRQDSSSQDEETVDQHPLATDSDLTDMNDTLLKLSNNANNANGDGMMYGDPFGTGDSQWISSPDSSGIDAGSVLLDLDPFSGNQNGMTASVSGTFSSRDSVDTVGITPSSPSSDAIGFGSGSEDLLGLDTSGSTEQTLPNPFTDSSKSVDIFDDFMSKPVPTPDLVSFDAGSDLEAQHLTSVFPVSVSNPTPEAGDTSNVDLLGLDSFAPSPPDLQNEPVIFGGFSANDPFGVMDSAANPTDSKAVDSSSASLGEFMNQLPGSPDGIDQFLLDPSSEGKVDLMSSETDADPFLMDALVPQSSDSTDQPSDGFATASLNPFEASEPCAETSETAEFESTPMDFSAHTDYHPGSPGFSLPPEPSDQQSTDHFSGSPVTTDEQALDPTSGQEEASKNDIHQDHSEIIPSESQNLEELYPTPEVTITLTSNSEYEVSEVADVILEQVEDNNIFDTPSDDVKIQEAIDEVEEVDTMSPEQDAELTQEDEGFCDTEHKGEMDRGIFPSSDLGTLSDRMNEDFAEDGERVALEAAEDIAVEPHSEHDVIEDLSNKWDNSTSQEKQQDEVSQLDAALPEETSAEYQPSEDAENITKERQESFDEAEAGFGDFAAVDTDTSLGEALAEAVPDRDGTQSSGDSSTEFGDPEHQPSINVKDDHIEASDEDTANYIGDEGHGRLSSEEEEVIEVDRELSNGTGLEASPQPQTPTEEDEDAPTFSQTVVPVDEVLLAENTEVLEASFPDDDLEPVDDTSDDAQEIQEGSESHNTPSEDVSLDTVNTDDVELEVSLPQMETQEDEETISSHVEEHLESVSGTVDEFPATTGLTLEVAVAGAPGSIERNLSPMLDETAAPSSGITSPESDFTSDIISDDPSSGDSYIVTDLSHEVSNFQIVDIKEEAEEEEEQLAESEKVTEIHIDVNNSAGEQENSFAEDNNGNPDLTVTDDLQGYVQTEVIDDYFAQESQTSQVEKDAIPIPTDIGLASSGRSSPSNISENQDTALLQEEAHDLVEGVIKMAKFAFLEEEDKRNKQIQMEFEETTAESPDEQLVRGNEDDAVERGEQETASSMLEAAINQTGFSEVALDSQESTNPEEKLVQDLLSDPKNERGLEEEPVVDVPVDDILQATSAHEEFIEPLHPGEPEDMVGFVSSGQDILQSESVGIMYAEPPIGIVEEEVTEVIVSQEESALIMSEELLSQETQSVNTLDFQESTNQEEKLMEDILSEPQNERGLEEEPVVDVPADDILQATSAQEEFTEPLHPGEPKDTVGSVSSGQDILQSESVGNMYAEPPIGIIEEEVKEVIVSQEESALMISEDLPSQETQTANEEVEDVQVDEYPVRETSDDVQENLPAEQEVEIELDQDNAQQLEGKHLQNLIMSTEENSVEESAEAPRSPIEVNVVISEEGLHDGEVPDQSSSGKRKLLVEDSIMDDDLTIEDDNRQTSMFGLADILEYVNPDGEVEDSSADPHVRPSTLALTARSTPKSTRLLSAGTPISMLSDTGTPLTPVSLRSLDMVTSDTGTDEDTLDRTRDEDKEDEEENAFKRVSPPAAKRCISIDQKVVEDIHGEWDDKKKLMDDIAEKERNKQLDEKSVKPSPQREMSFGSAEAKQRMEGVELPDEWQDDEFSQQKLAGVDSVQEEDSFFKRRVPPKDNKSNNRDSILSDDGSVEGMNAWAERLAGDDAFEEEDEEAAGYSLQANGRDKKSRTATSRKVVPIPEGLSLSMEGDPLSTPSTPAILTPTSAEMSWDDDTLNSPTVEPIPEYTAKEEMEDRKNWRKVIIANKEFTLDMRAINPYKKVLSHGGYYGDGVNAIIVVASCYMPDRSRRDYTYIMNNLFLYVISTLELLVAQDYVIVYFHGAAPKNRIPSLNWMRKCYQMIDRKLRKNLKGLYIVHPTTWLRTIVRFTRPFISSKFSRKLKFVDSLDELPALVNMEYIYVPDEVRRVDKQHKAKGRK